MGQLDFEEKLDREVKKIESSDQLSEENRKTLLDFKRDMGLQGLKDSRIHKLLVHMRTMAQQLGDKSLKETTEDDLKDLIEWVQNRRKSNGEKLAEATVQDYKSILKRFYRWANGGEEHPEKVGWIKTGSRKNNDKLPEGLLTEEEISELLKAAKNPRDRAFIALLWETGARIGELIDLKVGSFEDREHGKKVVIHGKTGARRLPLISSIPQVNDWIAKHPNGDDPKAPLWAKLNGPDRGKRLSYRYMRKSLEKIMQRAGIDKPSNPHHFRHSRATYMANRFTEAQLCEWFGWVQGSKIPAKYVHLSGRDIDSAYDQLHGVREEEGPEKAELSPQECPRCGEVNEPGSKYCHRCGLALTLEAVEEAEEVEEKRSRADKLMTKLVQDPEVQQLLKRKLKELEGD